MNPIDYLLLVAWLVPVGMLLVSGRGSVHEFGPFALGVFGGVWHFWFQWLRHRTWLRHRHEAITPGTQHLANWAIFGMLFWVVMASVWFFATHSFPLTPFPPNR